MADEVKRRPRRILETIEEVRRPISRPVAEPLEIPTPRVLEDPPDWYIVALGQADRVFGESVYRSLSQIANGNNWSEATLTTFQTGVVRGVELRNAVINKLQGIVALEALSTGPDTEKGHAVQRVQSKTGELSSGRRDETPATVHVREPRREF